MSRRSILWFVPVASLALLTASASDDHPLFNEEATGSLGRDYDTKGRPSIWQPLLAVEVAEKEFLPIMLCYSPASERPNLLLPRDWSIPALEPFVMIESEAGVLAHLPNGKLIAFERGDEDEVLLPNGKWKARIRGSRFIMESDDAIAEYNSGKMTKYAHKDRFHLNWKYDSSGKLVGITNARDEPLLKVETEGEGEAKHLKLTPRDSTQAVSLRFSRVPDDLSWEIEQRLGYPPSRVEKISLPGGRVIDIDMASASPGQVAMKWSAADPSLRRRLRWDTKSLEINELNGLPFLVEYPSDNAQFPQISLQTASGPLVQQQAHGLNRGVYYLFETDGSVRERTFTRVRTGESLLRKEIVRDAKGKATEVYRASFDASGGILRDQGNGYRREYADGVYRVYKDGKLVNEY